MKRATLILTTAILLTFFLFSTLNTSAKAPQATTATYLLTFDATWSEATHPHPLGPASFPGGAHFTRLVGATHNTDLTVWREGQLATLGVEKVAETGNPILIVPEIDAAIAAGTADKYVQSNSGLPSPFTITFTITATADFPLLSLVSMVAPSPDWIVGLDSYSLVDGNGNFIFTDTIPLYPYDAGTEDGNDYSTGFPDTDPKQLIQNYTGVTPFSSEPLGTLTIERLGTSRLFLPLTLSQ